MIENNDMEYFLHKTTDPTFRGAVFTYLSTALYTNSISKQNFSCTILNEAVVTSQIVFYFTKNFYLVDEINEKISQFKANGLMEYWISRSFSSSDSTFGKFSPTSLNLKNVQGIFILYAYGSMIATIVFVCELAGKIVGNIFRHFQTSNGRKLV